MKMLNFRSNGVAAKINVALDGLPTFTALRQTSDGTAALAGRIHIGPGIDYLEHAFDDSKYGEFSRAPFLDISIPTILDNSLAPAGKHVMSIYMQFAPYKLKSGDWSQQRDALRDTVIKTVAQYAPDFAAKILAVQTSNASRSRSHLWPNRRPPIPRRISPRPNFHHAPAPRLGPLRHPSEKSLPLRQRHPPRQRRNRRLRPQRRPRNREAPPIKSRIRDHLQQTRLHGCSRGFLATDHSLLAAAFFTNDRYSARRGLSCGYGHSIH